MNIDNIKLLISVAPNISEIEILLTENGYVSYSDKIEFLFEITGTRPVGNWVGEENEFYLLTDAILEGSVGCF